MLAFDGTCGRRAARVSYFEEERGLHMATTPSVNGMSKTIDWFYTTRGFSLESRTVVWVYRVYYWGLRWHACD